MLVVVNNFKTLNMSIKNNYISILSDQCSPPMTSSVKILTFEPFFKDLQMGSATSIVNKRSHIPTFWS